MILFSQMTKRGLQSNLGNTADDGAFNKLSSKEKGKAIGGNPDRTDEKWLGIWVDLYEKAYPGRLARMAKDVQVEVALSGITKHAEVNKGSSMRKAFWLPEDLQEVLERAYPSFWTNPKHAAWFCRKFPFFAYETYTKREKA